MSGLQKTPLHGLNIELGGRMVPFAGYDMPVQFAGIVAEHSQTREKAGIFDVSHMGQVIVSGGDAATRAAALEALMPMDVAGLAEGRQRYGLFLNDAGGIRDDLMFANRGDHLFLVVNAACKEVDIAHLRAALEPALSVTAVTDRALIALQGPLAEAALAPLIPGVAAMRFMDVAVLGWQGHDIWVSRSGYTGEDGFEISVPEGEAEAFARALLDHPDVGPIGLGARDSLRLEAGLCLYGADLDETTTPVEAGLTWAIQKRRRQEGGFPGSDRIIKELQGGATRRRVGLLPEGRAPMRGGVPLFATETDGTPIGQVTSGGFGPTIGAPVAMGYVETAHAGEGMRLFGEVRGKRLPVQVAPMPFVPVGFKR